MTLTTKRICLLAMGIALFVALSLCLQVPVFENYYLCLGYVVMAVYCYSFGVISGTVVGALGVVLYCLLINGMRGMPGWALGNVALGIVMGLAFHMSKRSKNKVFRAAVNIAGVAVGTALGILVVKSLTECLLYAQPFAVRVGKNVYAFVADLVVLMVSLTICPLLDKTAKKLFPGLTGYNKQSGSRTEKERKKYSDEV